MFPPPIRWPGPQALSCPYRPRLLCLRNDQKARFPKQLYSTARDKAEFRPAWWHSSVLMQMRLHVELVTGVNEDWAQQMLKCVGFQRTESGLQLSLRGSRAPPHPVAQKRTPGRRRLWGPGPTEGDALGQCILSPSSLSTLPSALTSLEFTYLGL